jgi:hypothetical protein
MDERRSSAAGSRGHGAEARQTSLAWPVGWSKLFGVAVTASGSTGGYGTANGGAGKGRWDAAQHTVSQHPKPGALWPRRDPGAWFGEPRRAEDEPEQGAANRGSDQPEHYPEGHASQGAPQLHGIAAQLVILSPCAIYPTHIPHHQQAKTPPLPLFQALFAQLLPPERSALTPWLHGAPGSVAAPRPPPFPPFVDGRCAGPLGPIPPFVDGSSRRLPPALDRSGRRLPIRDRRGRPCSHGKWQGRPGGHRPAAIRRSATSSGDIATPLPVATWESGPLQVFRAAPSQ